MSAQEYIAQAERLAAHYAAIPGARRKHHEILEAVAALHGAKNWDTLLRLNGEGLASMLRHSFGRKKTVPRVMDIDEMRYSIGFDELQLGVSADGSEKVALNNSWVLRHQLVLATNGFGARSMLQHMAAQQIARGGGYLFVDLLADKENARSLETVAKVCGREGDFQSIGIIESGLTQPRPDMRDAIDNGHIIHCHGMLSDDGAQQRTAVELLDEFWEVVYARFSTEKRRPKIPFLLIVPVAGSLVDAKWAMRFAQARALGVAIILQDSSIQAFSRAGANISEIATGNTFTKTFFKQPTSLAVASALETIEASTRFRGIEMPTHKRERKASEQDTFFSESKIRDALVNLSMGEALVLSGSELKFVNICLLNLHKS